MRIEKFAFVMLTAVAGASTLTLSTPPAQAAVTFTTSIPNVIDFGEVEIGKTKTISWAISWTSDVSGASLSQIRGLNWEAPEFSLSLTNFGCAAEGNDCTYDLSFSPSLLGLALSGSPVIMTVREPDYASSTFRESRYVLEGRGIGVSPVPVPAGLALIAGALAALGLLGTRSRSA